MMFDILSTIEITVSAAIVVAMLAFGFATTTRGRIEVALVFAAWFALAVALGATLALAPARGGAPALAAAVALPLASMCGVYFAVPALRAAFMTVPLPAFVALNVLRAIGVSFILLYAAGRLPAPFAPSAGWGDVFVGVTALPMAGAAAKFGPRARGWLLAWNTIGVLDLIAAVGFGATSAPGPIQIFVGPPNTAMMTTLPWLLIPGFLVPAFLFIHIAIFDRLIGRERVVLASRQAGDSRATMGSASPAQ
jgi:hypothetical protein